MRVVKTLLAVSYDNFSFSWNQLGRPDALLFLKMYDIHSSQMNVPSKFRSFLFTYLLS